MTIAKTSRIISIISILLLIFTGYCIFDLRKSISHQHAVDAERTSLQILTKELQDSSLTLTAEARNYANTGNIKYLKNYNYIVDERSGKIPRGDNRFVAPGETISLLDLNRRSGCTDEEMQYLEETINRSIDLAKMESQAFELVKQGKLAEARDIMYSDAYAAKQAGLMEHVEKIEKVLITRLVNEASVAAGEVTKDITLLCIFIAVNIAIALFSAFFSDRRIVHRLEICSDYAARLAEGHYEDKLTKKHPDELGTMVDTLNQMVDSIQARIGDAEKAMQNSSARQKEAESAMKEAEAAKAQAERAKRDGMLQAANDLTTVVDAVSKVSKALNNGIALSDKGAKDQAHIVLETVGSMDEMKAAVHGVAQSASQASTVAQSVRTKAQEGVEQVAQVTSSMAELSEASNKISKDMELLGKQANDIGAILSTISDIADQTNLLALNAAIEAARAGEAGRGFAVVADEVRKLAEKTMSATQEVNSSISAIQQSVHTNIQSVGATGEMAHHVTEIVQQSGAVLDEINNLAEASADQVRAIAAAAEEQSVSCDHISQSVDAISNIANQVVDTMQTADSAVKDLLQQADRLSGLIDEMKKG